MSTSASQVATLFLQALGAPTSPDNVKAVTVWLNAENSDPTLRNNPWNLHSTGGLPGQTGSAYVGSGDQDVAIFGTIQAGVTASAKNLVNLSSTYPQYGQAVAALQAGNATGFLSAIAASPWSAGHYRINGTPGTNSLLAAFNGSGTLPAVNPVVPAAPIGLAIVGGQAVPTAGVGSPLGAAIGSPGTRTALELGAGLLVLAAVL